MYALAHKAIEMMISERFGPAAWQGVRARTGLDVDGLIGGGTEVPHVTRALVEAAITELGIERAPLIGLCGEAWIEVFADRYGPWMRALGADLGEFLVAFPDCHTRLALATPTYLPAWYSVEPLGRRHYRVVVTGRDRPYLDHYAGGMMRGIVRHFGVAARVSVGPLAVLDDDATRCAIDIDWGESDEGAADR